MEPLRLLFGLLLAMMSVGVLVFPISWPFTKDRTAVPAESLEASLKEGSSVSPEAPSLVKLADIPTDTVLSVQPITSATSSKVLADQLSLAKYLSAEKQFDEALDVLAKLPTADQDRYQVVYMRARILSWSGRYLASEQKFKRLMAKHPNDTDLMVSYGYLQFYQGNHAEAEKAFKGVLDINPDYPDAHNGLAKARKAM